MAVPFILQIDQVIPGLGNQTAIFTPLSDPTAKISKPNLRSAARFMETGLLESKMCALTYTPSAVSSVRSWFGPCAVPCGAALSQPAP